MAKSMEVTQWIYYLYLINLGFVWIQLQKKINFGNFCQCLFWTSSPFPLLMKAMFVVISSAILKKQEKEFH